MGFGFDGTLFSGWQACHKALSADLDLIYYQDHSIFSRLLTADKYEELAKHLDAHLISFGKPLVTLFPAIS